MSRFVDTVDDNSVIDQDNKARAERLATKLARLKHVAVTIEEETRDHIPMLDDVDDSHERTFAALSSGHKRLIGLMRSNRKNRRVCCYTFLMVLMLMIALYLWLARGS